MEDTLGNRIRYRRYWLLSILLAGVATYIIGQQWLFVEASCRRFQDTLHISFTLFGMGLMGFLAIKRQYDASFLHKLNTVGTVFAIGLLIPLIGGILLSPVRLVRAEFCPSCDERIANAEELRTKGLSESDPSGTYKVAEDYLVECINQKDPAKKSEAELLLARILIQRADFLLGQKNCQGANVALDRASILAEAYGKSDFLDLIRQKQRNRDLSCPTPTPVPTPTALPTPTRLPTPTPTPTPIGGLLQCIPPERAPIYTIRVSDLIPNSQPAPAPRQQFYDLTTVIPYRFTGQEYVCLASTEDGRGDLQVDDLVQFEVIHAEGGPVSGWIHDFYDPRSGGISPIRARNATRLFTRGGNTVRVVLRDLFPNVYSANPIWVVIWSQ